MNSRNYNKLHVNRNQEMGSEKISLGYQYDALETILLKDTETYFHIPYYTTPIKISESSLIAEGATGGPFPAAADKIYQSRKNYGNVSPNGTPTDIADGGWFCSWLYKDDRGNLQWMDRFYNPGKLAYASVTSQLYEEMVYDKNDPIFRDEPSSMVLEPGVLYKYFHIGENTANQIISNFGGLNGEHIKLNLKNWGTETVDETTNPKIVHITTDADYAELYPDINDTDRTTTTVISFDHNKNAEVNIDYDSSYALNNEFTLSFWGNSPNWNESPTTQLVGNYSTNGGVGVFIDTLSSYPFFVIPETSHGHMLYVNEQGNGFLDHNLSITASLTSTPQFVAIDSDHNVIVCNSDKSKRLTKLDHTGNILLKTNLPNVKENIMQIICDQADGVIVITNKNHYLFDKQFNLTTATARPTLSTTIASFAYDSKTNFSELNVAYNVFDSKYIETTNWCISAADGNLYRKLPDQINHELFTEFKDTATTFNIDPYNRIWVLHGNNNVSIVNTTLDPLSDKIATFVAGANTSLQTNKNISFFCSYSRTTQEREWKAIVYYSDDTKLYIFDIDGNLIQAIDVFSLFDYKIVQKLKQNSNLFKYNGRGDFTGYERKRVFNNLFPYKNATQLILKVSLKNKTSTELSFTHFKTAFLIKDWLPNSWQHIVVTLKNRKFTMYVNGKLVGNLEYSGKYELSYELRPALFIGSPVGNQIGFNKEVRCNSSTFNGMIQDVKIFDYVLSPTRLEVFQRAAIPAQNINWSLPIPATQYIETIERMFKNKIPGAKSTYFNIKLGGTQIKDAQTKLLIEQGIRTLVSDLQPAYANFLNIKWI